MTEKTLISPSGKTLLHVATRQTTAVSDARVKDVRLASAKERRLEENRKYLKNHNVQAFLAAISKAEGGDYNLMYGGVVGKKNDKWRFTDFSTHPGPGSDGRTTAAGRYQINKANWQENGVKKMGLSDFSPETQDLIAVESIRQVHALENVIEGDIDSATRKTSSVWAAIPKGAHLANDAGQPYMQYERFLKIFVENGGKVR